MSYVVTFENFVPIARYDSLPWTTAEIYESDTETGTYLLIDTFALDPIDPDPTNPLERDFTSENAQFENGWYKVVFLDASGDTQPTEVVHRDNTRSNYMPTVGDVGTLLRARTRDSNGVEQGRFTADTRPTADQAESIIDMATSQVQGQLPAGTVPTSYWSAVSELIAIDAAMLIELSYFPEQIRSNNSAYPEYKDMYSEKLARLIERIDEEGVDPGVIISEGAPQWDGFPPAYEWRW